MADKRDIFDRRDRFPGHAPEAKEDDALDKPSLAVALTWNPKVADAPRVVAKGQGSIAEQIIALAFAHGVRVREDADLAQILSVVELDQDIPVEAFVAVAEILAYVYRMNNRPLPTPSISSPTVEAGGKGAERPPAEGKKSPTAATEKD